MYIAPLGGQYPLPQVHKKKPPRLDILERLEADLASIGSPLLNREHIDTGQSDGDAPSAALPSSPSVLSNLHFFVKSQVNSLTPDDESSSSDSRTSNSSSYTRSPSPTSSSSSVSSKEHQEDLEAIEVLNALAQFESIGSSVGSDETLSGSFYLDQPLSPVLELEEPLKDAAARASNNDEVFPRSSTSEGIESDLEMASVDAISSSHSDYSSSSEEDADTDSVVSVKVGDDADTDASKTTSMQEVTIIIDHADADSSEGEIVDNAVIFNGDVPKEEPVEENKSLEEAIVPDEDSSSQLPAEGHSAENGSVRGRYLRYLAEDAIVADADSSSKLPAEGHSAVKDIIVIDDDDADSSNQLPAESQSLEEDTVVIDEADADSSSQLPAEGHSAENGSVRGRYLRYLAEDAIVADADSSSKLPAEGHSAVKDIIVIDDDDADSSNQLPAESQSLEEDTVVIDEADADSSSQLPAEGNSTKNESVRERYLRYLAEDAKDVAMVDDKEKKAISAEDGADVEIIKNDTVGDDVDVITMDDLEVDDDSEDVQSETGTNSDTLKEASVDEDIVMIDMDEDILKEAPIEDAAETDPLKNTEDDTDTDTLINLAIEDDDSQLVKVSATSPTGSESSDTGTIEGFEFVSKEDLEVASVSTPSPVSSEDEMSKSTLIVIKLVNGKSEYERVLPYDHAAEATARKNNKRKRVELLKPASPLPPEDDPLLKEMVESFKVDEILKVMDEPGILDTSSLLNSECGESRSSFVVASKPSHEKITVEPGTYEESFDIEEPQSPLISKIDEMIETFRVDVDLTLCPCSSLKRCIIL
ncbi:serine-aspartate repeat-containing protein F-like [Bolinopsis microptera]|uniref:serine-aspartate repeat-containing protein F-like n=1 Tax=Bolinopsis microptera TaxID=2820187 RepID=UPI003079FAC2